MSSERGFVSGAAATASAATSATGGTLAVATRSLVSSAAAPAAAASTARPNERVNRDISLRDGGHRDREHARAGPLQYFCVTTRVYSCATYGRVSPGIYTSPVSSA